MHGYTLSGAGSAELNGEYLPPRSEDGVPQYRGPFVDGTGYASPRWGVGEHFREGEGGSE